MEKSVSLRFTEEDREMLKNIRIPPNPCKGCYSNQNGTCCGCPKQREYDQAVKVYKDAGIYEIACKAMELDDVLMKQKELEQRRKELLKELPDFLGGEISVNENGCIVESKSDAGDQYLSDLMSASSAALGGSYK